MFSAQRLDDMSHEDVLDPQAKHAAAQCQADNLSALDHGRADQAMIAEAILDSGREYTCPRLIKKHLQFGDGKFCSGRIELCRALE